ncbi:MAG: alpha/beta hydrolase [Elusimicrobia bacterium]|nr:alpha/beta hydrolase [Elusimicrobiota bacterium]
MEIKKLRIIYQKHFFQIEYFSRPGPKETIVYLHGLGCFKEDFTPILDCHGFKDHALMAFDFPGHGNSPYPPKAMLGINDLVEIANKVRLRLKINRLIIIGHSMGGLVGLLYAIQYPKQVKGFINVEGNLVSEDCSISRQVAKLNVLKCKTFLRDLKQKKACSTNRGFQKYAQSLQKVNPRAYFHYCLSLVEYSDGGNLLRKFAGLGMPKLFIYGSENKHLSYLPKLKNSGCEVREIANSNHSPGYDNPKAYCQTINNFLHGHFAE